jgi:chemotaxis protein MotB
VSFRSATAARGQINEPQDPLNYKDDDDMSWLIPYVDVISLLLAFLILTLAMSTVSRRKFEMLSSTLSKQQQPPSLDVLKESVDKMLRAQKLENAVATSLDEDGLRAVFRGDGVLFESGQAEITATGRALIGQFIALAAKAVDERHQIAIEGHTDDVPIHTGRYDSNWELSSARATVVLKAFLAAGFDPHRLSAQGFADTRPAHALPRSSDKPGDKSADTEARNDPRIAKTRAENRRVVIRVYSGGIQ